MKAMKTEKFGPFVRKKAESVLSLYRHIIRRHVPDGDRLQDHRSSIMQSILKGFLLRGGLDQRSGMILIRKALWVFAPKYVWRKVADYGRRINGRGATPKRNRPQLMDAESIAEPSSRQADPVLEASRAEVCAAVRAAACSYLEEDERALVTLVFGLDLRCGGPLHLNPGNHTIPSRTIKEAADRLGIPHEQAYPMLKRALRTLENALGHHAD